jgi:transcriptional adapter 3
MDVDEKAKPEENDDDSSSEDDGRPPPPAPRPQANTYGDDPSTFPDPTVYEILPVQPGMTEDEIKEIYSVETYPKNDLADLIAGDPPDKDFSSAKPSNQINFSTFSTYIEPHFRPFTEEDLAFLRERGDRSTPFVIPRRGKKHYSEIWAEADGGMAIDSSQDRDSLPPNQARGTIEALDDDVAETDKLSVGPLLARILSGLRVEHRAPPPEPAVNGLNGDVDTVMGGVPGSSFDTSFGGDAAAQSQPQFGLDGMAINGAGINGTGTPAADQSLPPATCIPESSSEAWKKASHPKLEYPQVDERLRQELRHIGFLPSPPNESNSSGGGGASSSLGGGNGGSGGGANGGSSGNGAGADPSMTADYDGHYDDEIAARLRLLQSRLREQALVNGARKARLAELVKERMAYQEYQTILEDLDSQVQAAYLKRTRTMGKKPKKARPGASASSLAAAAAAAAAGGVGTARPGIGDMTRTLMERRRRWIDNIGTVFDGENLVKVPRVADEGSSIFKPEEMSGLIKKEKEAWDEDADEE